MKEIIEDNYKSIVARGLITPDTTMYNFMDKLDEEVEELRVSITDEETTEELVDIILVCLNVCKHFDIDIEKALKEKIKINFDRAKNI